jgi:RNA recognition motif-containing protein
VKNFPAGWGIENLKALFSRYGETESIKLLMN